MKFNRWPKRDPIKNYFPVPNEIYHLGLEAVEIAIYGYLLSIEDRKTYQCYPNYKTIGRAVKMSSNTVRKYVAALEEKGLISTEATMIRRKDGRPMNGSLLYTIRPIQSAVEMFYARQFRKVEEDADKHRMAAKLAKLAHRSPCEPPWATLAENPNLCHTTGETGGVGPLSDDERGSNGFPTKPSESVSEDERDAKEKAG